MIRTKLEAIQLYFRLRGLKGGIVFLVELMRYGKESIYRADFTEKRPDFSTIINPKLCFHFIENTEQYDFIASGYAAVKGKALASRDKERIASGQEYMGLIYREGHLAGWGWVKKGPLTYGNCKVGESECVIHKCRTLRAYRNQGVYSTLLVSLQDVLADRGFQRAYIGAKSFNKVSLRGIERTGFDFVEECNLGSFVSRFWNHIRGRGPKVMQTGN